MSNDNKRMNFRVSVLAAALATLPAFSAYAAGLGKLTVISGLGQPLRAELDISASREELSSLTAKIAPQESFRQANIEYSHILSGLRFTLDKRPNGQPYFKVSSDRAIGEPFLDMLVELSWSSGRLVREYTFLLDPPELAKPAAVDVPPPVSAPVTAPVAPVAPAPKREVERPAPVAEKPVEKVTEKPADKAPEKTAKVPAPAKPAAAPAASRPAVAEKEVRKGDTLGKIANETRPDGVSLDQMLVALFRNNQEAFEGGNMNRLKAGKILSIPEKEAIAAIDAGEARKIVVAQSADFDGYKRKLAGAVAEGAPAKEEVAKQSSSGKIAPKVEDKAPVAPGKDKLQVSKTEASGEAAKVKALEEEKIAKDKALKEAQSRIAELEKNVATMKQLAELKSQAAADLQKQAAAKAAAEPAKKPEPPKAAEPAKPVEPPKEAAKPASPPVAEPPKADVKAAAVAPAENKPAEAVKPEEAKPEQPKAEEPPKPAAPPPAPKKPVVFEPEPEPSFLDENGPLVFGGAGLLALLAGYFGFSTWRKRKNAKAVAATDSVLSSSSVLDVTSSEGLSQLEGQPSEFGAVEGAGFGTGEGVDPIREADTFMAYGRDAQAEEILVDALSKTPENLPVYLKLLEIYAARKSVGQFNAIAQSLYGQTGGQGGEWERAVALGTIIDPANPLYGAPAESQSSLVDLAEPVAAAESVVAEIEPAAPEVAAAVEPATETGEAEALDLDFDLDTAAAPAAVEEPAAVEAEAVADAAMDFDLGEPAAPAEEPAAEVPAPAAAEDIASLDFDLDLGATPEAVSEAPAPAPAASEEAASLDIDFDLDSIAATSTSEVAATETAPAAADENVLDFDLDLGASAPAVEVAESVAPVEPPADLGLDLSLDVPAVEAAVAADQAAATAAPLDFDFDLGASVAAASEAPLDISLDAPELSAPPLDLSGINLDLSEPLPAIGEETAAPALDLSIDETAPAATDEDRPEVTTKLELAQAYEEMGDKEGAKELFQEVLAEGSSAQQAIAREKLAKLG